MYPVYGSERAAGGVLAADARKGSQAKLRFAFVALTFIHALICRYIQEHFLAATPSLAYMGLHWYDASNEFVALFVLLSILPAATFMPIESTRTDSFFLNVLYGTVYIPSVALLPNLTTASFQETLFFSLALLAGLMILVALSKGEWRAFSGFGAPADLYDKFLLVCSGLVILAYAVFTPARITSFDLSDLYTVRAEFFDAASTLPGPVLYIFGNAAFALAPIMVARGILDKKIFLGATGFFVGVATFVVTSLRSMMFGVALVAILSYLTRWKFPAGISVMTAFIMMAAVAVGVDSYRDAPIPDIVYSLHYRLFGNSASISSGYIEFFSNFPFFYYSQSILGPIFEPPSDAPYQVLVGESISAVRGNHANGNLAADAYANGGYISVLVSFFVLAMLIRLYSSLSAGKDSRMRALALVVPAFYLSNAGVQSALFSGGLVATLLLMAAFPLPAPLGRGAEKQVGQRDAAGLPPRRKKS